MKNETVVFFDGVCNICNKSVNFIIDRDVKNAIFFASLQSEYAKKKLLPFDVDPTDLNTIIFLENGVIYKKSDAALRICKHLNGNWKALSWCLIFPRFIRDFVYITIAKNRYKLFGKSDTCRLPTAEERAQFLG